MALPSSRFARLILRFWLPSSILLSVVAGHLVAAPKEPVRPTPPQPMSQKVAVARGASVDIPLKIYGTRAQTLSWLVRQLPAHGRLSPPRSTAAEAGTITYTPSADLGFSSDRFTYSVRSNEGVSAPAEVLISITDRPPSLLVPGPLDFGRLLTGSRERRVFEFSNDGGGLAEGEILVDPPWQIEGERHYKLQAGQSHRVSVIFAPRESGSFQSEVRFSSQTDRSSPLQGAAEEALSVTPAPLELKALSDRPVREGILTMANNTPTALNVTLETGPRLRLPATLTLPPLSKSPVSVQMRDDDVASLEDTLRITAGKLTTEVKVHAPALPALVRADRAHLFFRRKALGAAVLEPILFENKGGQPAHVLLEVSAPFTIDAKSVALAVGEKKTVGVILPASAPAIVQAGTLKVASDSLANQIISLQADALEAPAATVSSPPSAPARAVPARFEPSPARSEATNRAELIGTRGATVLEVTGQTARFSWVGSLAPGSELRCLRRLLTSSANPDEPPTASFVDYPAVTFTQDAERVVATVQKLSPGQTYFFRIDALDPPSENRVPVAFAQFRTPAGAATGWHVSLLSILITLAVFGGGLALWKRFQASRPVLGNSSP